MKTSSNPLCVLITRPKPAGEILLQKITAAGTHAVFFPTIDFLPPHDPAAFEQAIDELDTLYWLIFISPQSVYAASPLIHERWPILPPRLKIAAVGAGTAAALRQEKFPAVLYPIEKWDTEGLLEMPEFQFIADQRIGIARGEDGREVLADTLAKRGATILPIIAYQRVLPKTDVNNTLTMLHNNEIDVVVCTSVDGLQNLVTMLQAGLQKLHQVPLIVISSRMLAQAKELGFKKTFLAKNAGHDAIMAVLEEKFALKFQKGSVMENKTVNPKPAVAPAATPATPRRSQWGNLGILFATFGFIMLIAIFYFGYNALMNSDKKLANLSSGLTSQMNSNQQDIGVLRHQLAEVLQASQQLQTVVTNQQQVISQIHDNSQNVKDTANIGEAQYLAALANDNLQVGDNIPLVITLLQTADQKMRDLADPAVEPVRKALAADIAALQAVPAVDATGIYMKVSALNTQTDKLPLPTQRPAEPTSETDSTGQKASWWRRGLRETGAALRQIVVIRYNKSGQQPFMTPDQQSYLYQNLHAMFEQAMSAVVHKQPDIYRASLTQASDWIKQYFLTDAPATQAMLSTIDELQKQTLKPTLPDINATLQAFRDLVSQNNSANKPAATSTSD